MTESQKNAVIFLGSKIEKYKIKKVFNKSFKDFLDAIEKDNSIDTVFIQPQHLSIDKLTKLLYLNKKIVILEPLKIDSIIKC